MCMCRTIYKTRPKKTGIFIFRAVFYVSHNIYFATYPEKMALLSRFQFSESRFGGVSRAHTLTRTLQILALKS